MTLCRRIQLKSGTAGGRTSALIIIGVVSAQMVQKQQHRRDNALHLKIYELSVAIQSARNEVAGVEHAAGEEIYRLRAERHSDEQS